VFCHRSEKLSSGHPERWTCWYLLCLIIAVGFQACQPKTQPVAVAPQITPSAPAPLPPLALADPDPETLEVDFPAALLAEISQSGCYGSCPAFQAKVMADGTVLWEGFRHVTRLGKWKAVAPANWTATLMQAADKAAYYSLQRQYPAVDDQLEGIPLTTTYFHAGKQRRQIQHRADGPLALQHLEQTFREMLEKLSWTAI
jgi:hypothetical protein